MTFLAFFVAPYHHRETVLLSHSLRRLPAAMLIEPHFAPAGAAADDRDQFRRTHSDWLRGRSRLVSTGPAHLDGIPVTSDLVIPDVSGSTQPGQLECHLLTRTQLDMLRKLDHW
jgi:hypothetical protein